MHQSINLREALRYLGVSHPEDSLLKEIDGIADTLEKAVKPHHTYRVYDLEHTPEGVRLAGTELLLTGRSTEKMLESCEKVILFACTIGAPFEQLLRREQSRDMSRAVLLDACGSAYVEYGCDALEEELRASFPGWYFTDRFSPGYGDLPLDAQRGICTELEVTKRLGIHLSESLLMNPTKSVTAVIGLSREPQAARIRGCAYCTMRDSCWIRKGGSFCGT